ncbi:hypothetical protein Cob_v004961 [Colletotrichum orbiculare MAFF 240422]|uniref:Uncharacterized protein n=1 Tax=Colletotrichum orbiculare (strain 104-T / ATCC 96160 / CBS 514.97 / LARS 414 / MAFF 240422) TaxID=1213857 RepID=N4VG33_COLOR|nr:hypothetical protein Cob_v004961 [Colletotrichum orbiculare MAFF 240422]
MARVTTTTRALALFLFLQFLGLTTAKMINPKYCKKNEAVSKCVSAVSKHVVKTAVVTNYCSSVLQCPPVTTTTLKGIVTKTRTKTKGEILTIEEASWADEPTTVTFSWTETSTIPTASTTLRPTWTIEKFAVTTAGLSKRRVSDPRGLPPRVRSACPAAVHKKACACLYLCPPMVTKDERKVVKTVEKVTSYSAKTVTVPVTDTVWEGVFFTETEYITETYTNAITAVNTRPLTCQPSASNPSFYLSATVSPLPTPQPYNNKFVQAQPDFSWFGEGVVFWPRYEAGKSEASLFTLDNQGRLVTETTYGLHYLAVDPYNDFQLVYLVPEPWLTLREWYFIYCKTIPPSGISAGNYRELSCNGSYFNVDTFQYCPIYQEWFTTGTVLGTELSVTTPDCFSITYLVVPACGS